MLPRLAEAIGFLAVFGLVGWALAARIIRNNPNSTKPNTLSNNNLHDTQQN